ncbi:MAG: YihA family ribosome biogenesis GTP-binding protein [Proteobacteria bacterium]|nr:MAG: YihA family ribosome biogenesis GTP-binding protein [Pseudomonadota bacterium]
MTSNYRNATFLSSATTRKTLPPEQGLEVAFAGRSNSGKSSTLNCLCGQKALARVSKTPGRTQLINFFALPDSNLLVDLPGYGYAKVPEKVKIEWQKFIESYMTKRTTLTGLVIIMDIRHPMREHDLIMLEWAEAKQLPVHVVLNKSDKLKRGAVSKSLQETKKALKEYNLSASVQTFSALKRLGVTELSNKLNSLFHPENNEEIGEVAR